MTTEQSDEQDQFDITQPTPDINKERADGIRAFLERRQRAYVNVFREGKPTADDLQAVINDLRWFCRGNMTPWADDARLHALLTGRNEVYVRIFQHIELPFHELFELYTSAPPTHEKDNKK